MNFIVSDLVKMVFHAWLFLYGSVFQPFSIRGTSWKFLITWRNLNVPYSAIFSIFKEPRKKLTEPLGSAEPRMKNTALRYGMVQYGTVRWVRHTEEEKYGADIWLVLLSLDQTGDNYEIQNLKKFCLCYNSLLVGS